MLNFYCDAKKKYLTIAAKEENLNDIALEVNLIFLFSFNFLTNKIIYYPGDNNISIFNDLFENNKEQLLQSTNMILAYGHIYEPNLTFIEKPTLIPCEDEKQFIHSLINLDVKYKNIFNKIADKSFSNELKGFMSNIRKYHI